jgi:hypothetical protein
MDGRIASLLASPFHTTAPQLLLIDLRATSITAVSVITIFQTCPLLRELDVGECEKFRVLELARRLEKIPRESLVVELLRKMEICGAEVEATGSATGRSYVLMEKTFAFRVGEGI